MEESPTKHRVVACINDRLSLSLWRLSGQGLAYYRAYVSHLEPYVFQAAWMQPREVKCGSR
jgi:hypothetical protein